MTKKENILIVVTTEMGLLISCLYYFKYKQDLYNPYFIILKGKEERFKNLDLSKLPGKYKVFEDKLQVSLKNNEKDFHSLFKYENIKEVVFQNPKSFISYSLITYYKNSSITLISDGIAIFSELNIKSKLALIFRLNYHKYINNLMFLSNTIPNNNSLIKKIDCFIAHQSIKGPAFIDTNDLIEIIPNYINDISKIFSFNINTYNNNDIIFFTQPIYIQNTIEKHIHKNYWQIVDKLCDTISKSNKKMIIKIHPSEDATLYDNFKKNNIIIDSNKNIPAEFILSILDKQIVISMFSSLSLIKLKNHTNLWLYKLIEYKLKSIKNTSHIIVPQDFDELKNYILKIKDENEKII